MAVVVNNATLLDFGLLCSNVHNAWMRVVAGRLENRYRYAPSVYYNFPFPEIDEKKKEKIIKTASAILEARNHYAGKSLADMYGEQMYLYPELLSAHQNNDRAVMDAYDMYKIDNGVKRLMNENECVGKLMEMYQALSSKE